MAVLPLPPLAIDADPDTKLPAYSGASFRAALSGLLTSGTSAGVARTGALDARSLGVTLTATNVTVAGGGYALGTPAGVYLVAVADAIQLGSLAPADPTNARVDRVVLRVDDPSNGGGPDRTGSIELIKGTPGATPTLPSVPGPTRYADLARIDVPRAGAGSPSVTDLRTYTAAQGGILPMRDLAQINAFAGPSGQVAYNATGGTLHLRVGGVWKLIRVESTSAVSLPAPAGGFTVQEALKAEVVDGTVYLSGQVSNSTHTGGWTTILTLPAGVRPRGSVQIRASGNTDVSISLRVLSSGALQVWYSAVSGSWVSLASIPPYRAA